MSAIWYTVSACLGVFYLPDFVLNAEIQMVNTIMQDLLLVWSLAILAKWINPFSANNLSSLINLLSSFSLCFYSQFNCAFSQFLANGIFGTLVTSSDRCIKASSGSGRRNLVIMHCLMYCPQGHLGPSIYFPPPALPHMSEHTAGRRRYKTDL